MDHVIVGGDNSAYFSFMKKGLLKSPCVDYQSDYHLMEWDDPELMGKE